MNRFAKTAWAFVAYLIGVILFGAWVRITGSGAGCGSHWPTCHGELLPPSDSVQTLIEYTHRLTSGFCGIFGLVVIVWAWRRYGVRHRVFLGAVVTMVFILLESLIGAGIVLKELVEDDSSVARAVIISIHLVNTLVLTGAAALTAWWAGGGAPLRWSGAQGKVRWMRWLMLAGLVGIGLTSMTGAITALGDTLFPTTPALGPELLAKVRGELDAANHFLVRLRVVHPVVASAVALLLLMLGDKVRDEGPTLASRRWALALMITVCAQVAVGLLNIAMAAPGWLQLCHLLVGQLLWICALLMTASALTEAPADAQEV